MMKTIFKNRTEAGERLARELDSYFRYPNTIVLALPRGGVPIAYAIAKYLELPLDICLVRKIGVPEHRELAMGAIAFGGILIINEAIIREFEISPSVFNEIVAQETEELARRNQRYRFNRLPCQVTNQTVILVDDGVATGATLKAAIALLLTQYPAAIIVAIPVAPPTISLEYLPNVKDIVCLHQPQSLRSISLWYDDFSQTTDEEVCQLLEAAEYRYYSREQ